MAQDTGLFVSNQTLSVIQNLSTGIKDMATTCDDDNNGEEVFEEENSDEKDTLLGGCHIQNQNHFNLFTEGGSKEYEDDFFLNGPKMNISSLRNQMDIIKK